MRPLQTWSVVGFRGYWPTGTAAVVTAASEDEARAVLAAVLPDMLKPTADEVARWQLQLVDTSRPGAAILCDGDY